MEELLRSPLVVRGVLVAPQLADAPRGAGLISMPRTAGVEVAELPPLASASPADTPPPPGGLAIGHRPHRTPPGPARGPPAARRGPPPRVVGGRAARFRSLGGRGAGEMLEITRGPGGDVERMHFATYALTHTPTAFADLLD